jgi:hypothetical protein
MSPRPGGETDKLGNKYELAWAIRHALYCIRDSRRSLTIEDVDPEVGRGSEFTYGTGSGTEVHQLKRQNGNSNSWTVKALADLKIFDAAAAHVAAGRQYHFVSLVPCRPLQELADRARRSADLIVFTESWLTNDLRPVFDQLAAPEVLGSAEAAWTTLRGMWFSVQDEDDIARRNSTLAELLLTGGTGHLISLAIGDVLLCNLGRRLTRTELLGLLADDGIRPGAPGLRRAAREQVASVTSSWRASVQRELLHPPIERAEANQLIDTLEMSRIGLVAGTAGCGKTSVLEQAVTSLESAGGEVLALRLDRLDSFASTIDLGRQLGLETSPAVALALAAENRDAYLVIDQLDAVSLASGRMPENFDVVMDLIGEALSVAGLRVILACREFDIENDHRIRALARRSDITQVTVGSLSTEAVDLAVASMGLDPIQLGASQRTLFQTPLHLVLLQTLATQDDALAFQSKGSLFEAFWERKRQTACARRNGVRFNDVLSRVANAASDRQVLSVPVEILDDGDLIEDANVLVSEHVLVRDGDRVAFFHESFFDYAFARQWVSRDESLVDFLLQDEQELFRRAQVRQILQHLYEREPGRFRNETEMVLTTDGVRFHIKETALAVIANLPVPTSEDAEMILRVTETVPMYKARLWQQLRQPQWFLRLHEEGLIASWLDGPDKDMREHALNAMASAVKEHPGLIATLLRERKGAPDYLDWLRRVVRFADMHKDRSLFDLMLDAVRQGGYDAAEHELWLTAHDLAKHKASWAIELLQARLIDKVDALALNDAGKVTVLGIREYGASELVREAASTEPLLFAQAIVPYLRQVMAATAAKPREDRAIRDLHFGARFEVDDMDGRELDDALLAASVQALEALARSAPDDVRSLLEDLASDSYDGSQFLLYRALAAGGANFADWAASLLLEGGRRLDCGYVSDSHWVARELVRAISPHISNETHRQLEDQLRDLRNPYETRRSAGRSAFTFLSALQIDRLSPDGRRRLGEYQRKFQEEAPTKPRGIVSGSIGSPIGSEAAKKMTDAQWLRAIAKHDSDRTDWGSFTGGARELSHVLREQVAVNPERFARLALQFKPEVNAAYTDAVLMGLGEAESAGEVAPLVFEAVRHIASLGQADNDRWLGMSLRRHYRDVPLDLVELVRDRALQALDPTDNTPVVVSEGSDDGQSAADMHMNGINTARGSLAEALGDLLVYDVDGQRTALVVPHLKTMAGDPVLSVRSCAAHTLAVSLRHARPQAIAAFETLIDADDRLLAAGLVQQLMLYIGNVDPEVVDPVIQRMLASSDDEAREAGGRMAAFAALEWKRPALMQQALAGDAYIRKGVAEVCAGRVDRTSDAYLAAATLVALMPDDDDEVRKAVARVASNLREHPLRPFAMLLSALIESPSYDHATPQLLLTLQHAPDKVDDLVLKAAQRFIAVFGEDAADIRTSAAGDSHYISELVVRGLAQSRNRAHRTALLDVLDRLLELGAYGIGNAIAQSERN